MKTKELLSLPVGKYICTDEICNSMYLLEVYKNEDFNPRVRLYEYSSMYPFSPYFVLVRDFNDYENKWEGMSWKGYSYLGGMSSTIDSTYQTVRDLNFVCKYEQKDQLNKHLKNFLIERICNTPNSDYRKRFLQDKLKQIIKNENI